MQQLVLVPFQNYPPAVSPLVKKLGIANIRGMKEDNETPDIPALKDRLTWARERKGKSKADVANAVGISRPAYHDLESGNNQKTAYIVQIAEFLEVNPRWLALNKGTHLTMSIKQLDNNQSSNYDHPSLKKLEWADILTSVRAGTGILNAFTYEYRGEAMDGSKGPSIPTGSHLHVDPQAEPATGRVVLAILDDEPVVGVLSINGGRRYARPSSQQFTAVDITDGQIIGVVVKITSPMP